MGIELVGFGASSTALRRTVGAVALALTALVLAGCGGDGAAEPGGLSGGTSDALRRDVAEIRTAAGAGRPDQARAAVAAFAASVQGFVSAGELHSADAQVLLAQAQQIEAGLAEAVAAQEADRDNDDGGNDDSGNDDRGNDNGNGDGGNGNRGNDDRGNDDRGNDDRGNDDRGNGRFGGGDDDEGDDDD